MHKKKFLLTRQALFKIFRAIIFKRGSTFRLSCFYRAKKKCFIIIGSVAGGVVLLSVIIGVVVYRCKKSSTVSANEKPSLTTNEKPPLEGPDYADPGNMFPVDF